MSEKTEKLGVNLTKEDKQKLRVEAAMRGMTMSELAREVILDELEGNPKPMAMTAD